MNLELGNTFKGQRDKLLINNNSSLDLRRKKIYNFFPLKLLKLFKIFLSLYSDHTKLIKISFEIYEKIISGYVLA